MDNFGDIDRYGRLYVYAKRWPEALYIYYRLANLAISRSNRAYADSYLQIGRIYFLTDQPEEAEKKWEISRRIYQDSFRSELDQLERRVEAIRTSRAAYSPPG
jgi:tetratricopeptide (TPR) repeat protein